MKKDTVHSSNQDYSGMTFIDWLQGQINIYLIEKEPKGKRRKGKGA